MSLEVERESTHQEVFLPCLIPKALNSSLGEEVAILTHDSQGTPLYDKVPKEDVIEFFPVERDGLYGLGLVREWILPDWTSGAEYVVDLHGPSYPVFIKKGEVIFNPQECKLAFLKLLEEWSVSHQKEIEEAQAAFSRELWIQRPLNPAHKN